jgi:hypothetical protein
MTPKELKEECAAGKWLPVLVMRSTTKNCPIVPLFDDVKVAVRFAERNLPSNWVSGVVNLAMRDAEWMDERGWEAIKFEYPRILKDIIEFDVEILEFEPDHELILNI